MNNEVTLPTWLEGLGIAGYLFVIGFIILLTILWIVFPLVVISQLGRLRKIQNLLIDIREHTFAARMATEELRKLMVRERGRIEDTDPAEDPARRKAFFGDRAT